MWSGALYGFLASYPLINWSTLFFLINKNNKSFSSFQKSGLIALMHAPVHHAVLQI
jgi:hypothetical protein